MAEYDIDLTPETKSLQAGAMTLLHAASDAHDGLFWHPFHLRLSK